MKNASAHLMERPNNAARGGTRAFSAHYLLVFGILIHLISWFLPVHENTRGYQAFVMCFPLMPGVIANLAHQERFLIASIPMALSAHTNYLVPITVLLILRKKSRSALNGIAVSLAAGLLCNLLWMTDTSIRTQLKFGYYLWLCSFAIIASAAIMARRNVPG